MNRQGNKVNPSGGIEWTHVFGPGTGYTWNPISGCTHECKWEMPNGDVAICYAKEVAERMQSANFFPQGFEHISFHADRLKEPAKKKQPVGIFMDSMSDLFGKGVKAEWIMKTLEVVRTVNQHNYLALTKNAPRLVEFSGAFPDNLWVGASTPPDFMFGKRLTLNQQARMLHRTLEVLSMVKTPVRWLSAEPLSWDISPILAQYPDAINWIVIGAASSGKTLYAPADEHVEALLRLCDTQRIPGTTATNIPVFFKGNMRVSTLPQVHNDWRANFPRYMNPVAMRYTMDHMTSEQWTEALGAVTKGIIDRGGKHGG